MDKNTNRAWYKKKRIYVIGAILLLFVAVGLSDDPNDQKTDANSEVKSEQKEEQVVDKKANVNVPKYSLVGTRENAGISGDQYYVLTDETKTDISIEEYKSNMKAIIQDLATKKSKAEFSALIYSDKELLDYNFKQTILDDVDENTALVKSMGKKSETALLASYYGGLNLNTAKADTSTDGYQVSYYTNANKSQSEVGKYFGEEKFKPAL